MVIAHTVELGLELRGIAGWVSATAPRGAPAPGWSPGREEAPSARWSAGPALATKLRSAWFAAHWRRDLWGRSAASLAALQPAPRAWALARGRARHAGLRCVVERQTARGACASATSPVAGRPSRRRARLCAATWPSAPWSRPLFPYGDAFGRAGVRDFRGGVHSSLIYIHRGVLTTTTSSSSAFTTQAVTMRVPPDGATASCPSPASSWTALCSGGRSAKKTTCTRTSQANGRRGASGLRGRWASATGPVALRDRRPDGAPDCRTCLSPGRRHGVRQTAWAARIGDSGSVGRDMVGRWASTCGALEERDARPDPPRAGVPPPGHLLPGLDHSSHTATPSAGRA